jgi:ribosomal-protein-alanine N-acetyltransferase
VARCRPWNDQTKNVAALRFDRGSDRFLASCCDWLFTQGVDRVLTPALADGQLRVWRRAGFVDHLDLTIFERSLARPAPGPEVRVEVLHDPDIDALVAIDDRAFDPTWRVGRLGLRDALTATQSAAALGVEDSGQLLGFLVVGEGGAVSYLQRLAVEPAWRSRGLGRSLVRAAIGWARGRGARTMLLNTQPDNRTAAGLYESEGFELLTTRLKVLSKTGEAASPP